ncbi:Putative polyol transporter 2 [Linum perenne]
MIIYCFSTDYADVGVMLASDTIAQDLLLTDDQEELVVHIARYACIVSAVVAGFAMNYIGRRAIILLGLFFHTTGVAVACIGINYKVIIMGRILMGLGFGFGQTAGPIYVTEVAPAAHRGLLISLSQLLFTFGQAFGYVAHYLAQDPLDTPFNWKLVIGIGVIPTCMVLGCLLFFFVESPCWLVLKGKIASANAVMRNCGATEAERRSRLNQLKYIAEIPAIVTAENFGEFPVQSISTTLMKPMWKEVSAPTLQLLSTLLFVAMLYAFPPLSGADMGMWMGRTYFETFGSNQYKKWYLVMDLVSVGVRMVASIFPILMVDSIGRRWVLRISFFFTACAAGIFGGVGFAGQLGAVGNDVASIVCLSADLVLQGAHAMGLGVMLWVCGPEMFEFRVRAPAVGIAVAIHHAVVSTIMTNVGRWYLMFHVDGIFSWCCVVMLLGFVFSFSFGKEELWRSILTDIVIPAQYNAMNYGN